MPIITTNLFPILCLCFTVVLCECNTEERKPWVLPKRYIDYDEPYIEFNCSAHLQPGEFLTWYKDSDRKQLTITGQKQAGLKRLVLLWPLALLSSGDNIFCSVEYPSSRTPSGVPIYSQTSTENIPIIFNRRIPPLDDQRVVMVTPEVFADDGNSVTVFTCWANLHQGELLSWYQIKDSKEIHLTRTQQENLNGYIKVKLVKTIEPSDNGTQLYCAKQQMSPKMAISKGVKSQMIQIKFQKHIQPLETPYITVAPRQDKIISDENEELKFVCSGSKPVDGRNITWLIQGPDMKISYPNNVFYDDTNRNHQLTLRMAQFYHKSQLYCAQDYKMKLQVPEMDQIINEYHYGMLVRSQSTTLLHRSILKVAAFVTVEPNTSVHFDVNTTLRFTCRGSKPVDGMTYSWFRIDSNSSLSIPEHQIYDPSTTTNILELSLNETFHQNQLYCAQGFTSFVQNTDDSMQILQRSNKITLIRRDKEASGLNLTIEGLPDNSSCGHPLRFIRTCNYTYNQDHIGILSLKCVLGVSTQEESEWIVKFGNNSSKVTLKKGGSSPIIVSYDIPLNSENNTVTCNATYATKTSSALVWTINVNVHSMPQFITTTTTMESATEPFVTVTPDTSPVYFDVNATSTFVCNGSKPLDGRKLAWFIQVEPFVTVTPDTSPVYFEANGTSTFVCNGSKPLVGRKLVWFIQGPDSKPVYATKQIYDSKTNVNNLVLRYNESYNEGVLYCAQSLVFHHVNAQEQFYDVAKESTVRSKNITLVQRIIEDNNENRSDDKGILGYADNNRPRDKVLEGDPKGNSDLTDASNTDENKDGNPKGCQHDLSVIVDMRSRLCQPSVTSLGAERYFYVGKPSSLRSKRITLIQRKVDSNRNRSEDNNTNADANIEEKYKGPVVNQQQNNNARNKSNTEEKKTAEGNNKPEVIWWLVGAILLTLVFAIVATCAAKHYKKKAQIERQVNATIRQAIQNMDAERRTEREARDRPLCPLPEQLYDDVYAHGAGLERPRLPRRAKPDPPCGPPSTD